MVLATARAKATLAKMTTEQKIGLTYGWNLPPVKCRHDFSLCPKWYVGNVPALPALGLPPINLEDGPQGVADVSSNHQSEPWLVVDVR